MKRVIFCGIFLFAFELVSCQPALLTPSATPSLTVTSTRQATSTRPTHTRTSSPAPTDTTQPTPTRTLLPTVTHLPTKTNTPTATPFPDPVSFPISPANGPEKWPLYNSANAIRVLLFDGTFIWAGSVEGGLTQWEPHSLTSIRHTRATGFPLNTVYDLDYDEESGYLYAVGDTGLAIWDGKSWLHRTQKYLGFAPDLPLTAVLADQGTMIWVGAEERYEYDYGMEDLSVRSDGGLAYGNWASGEWQHFVSPNAPSSNQINDLLLDADGNLWVACGEYGYEPTQGGVSVLSPDGVWTHYSSELENPQGLDGYAYGSLALGKDGTIYAGNRRGISYFKPGASKWATQDFDCSVYQMVSGADNTIWHPNCGQVYVGNRDQGWPTKQRWNASDETYSRLAIAQDGEQDIWVGYEYGLVEIIDGDVQPHFATNSLSDNWVNEVAINGDDTIWFYTLRGQPWETRYFGHLANGQLTTFINEYQAIEAAYPWTGHDSLWAVAPDGAIWFRDGELVVGYDGQTWKTLPPIPGAVKLMRQPAVGPDGSIAVVSEAGLSLYIPGTGWQEPTWPLDGRPYVRRLMFGQKGEIWMAESGGFYASGDIILKYLPTLQEWQVYRESDTGLGSVSPEGINLSPDGEIWAVGPFGEKGRLRPDGTWEFLGEEDSIRGFAEVYFDLAGTPWYTTITVCGFEVLCIDGLLNYNGDNLTHLTIENSGLINGWVNDLSFDSTGNIWLATGAGLQMMPRP